MNDPANQPNSYVDSYAPPTAVAANSTSPMPAPAINKVPEPVVGPTDVTPVTSQSTTLPSTSATASSTTSSNSQSLEDQNIFFLLGVEEIADEEKEAFLDELQQVIWEDFLENDVELLITENENVELKKVMNQTYDSDLDKQEAIVVYLEKLVPDLEEVMLEKAIDLKREMVDERLVSMREIFAGQSDKLQSIDQAADLIQQDKWREAGDLLNSVEASPTTV